MANNIFQQSIFLLFVKVKLNAEFNVYFASIKVIVHKRYREDIPNAICCLPGEPTDQAIDRTGSERSRDENSRKTSICNSAAMKRFDEEELDTNVRKLFTLIDVNGNGFVNLREFERHLAVSGVKLDREIVEQIYSLILSFNSAVGTASQIHARYNLRTVLSFKKTHQDQCF
jgi:hypothetical protein